jgi:dethiobiotin synthetase
MAGGLFITGTGTGVGKTYVAALIARELVKSEKRVGVYKPVASGCETRDGELVSSDAITLWTAAGKPGTLDAVCLQRFAAPLAPHLAARAERRRVDAALLRSGLEFWRARSDVVLIEGAGGLMSPISDDDYNADIAAEFGFPLVIVASNELGTINATLQTLITASTYCGACDNEGDTSGLSSNGLRIAGIVLNSPRKLPDDASRDSNADELERRCVPPLLAIVDHNSGFDRTVDWAALI